MKPVSANDLNSLLDDDLVWRRREMTTIVTSIKAGDEAVKNALVRAAVPLLYAHWEGFGRSCIQRYLEFVSLRGIAFNKLHPAFFYLSNVRTIAEIVRTPANTGIHLMSEMLNKESAINRSNFRKLVNTKSNLRFDVLKNLLSIAGLDFSYFDQFEDFINSQLCDSRNEIAHGAASAPTLSVFIDRRDKAFALMVQLQTLVVNAAINDQFRAKAEPRGRRAIG